MKIRSIAVALMFAAIIPVSDASAKVIARGASVSVVRPSIPAMRPSVSTFKAPPAPVRSQVAPTPVVQERTIVNRTVVHNSSPVHSGNSGGMGFFGDIMSSMAGSFIGSGISHWLFGNKEQSQPVQQVPVDCSIHANQQFEVCKNFKKN